MLLQQGGMVEIFYVVVYAESNGVDIMVLSCNFWACFETDLPGSVFPHYHRNVCRKTRRKLDEQASDVPFYKIPSQKL